MHVLVMQTTSVSLCLQLLLPSAYPPACFQGVCDEAAPLISFFPARCVTEPYPNAGQQRPLAGIQAPFKPWGEAVYVIKAADGLAMPLGVCVDDLQQNDEHSTTSQKNVCVGLG